jgi:DNA segregation ATPase FtsK/SpoIIIE, S-DNA-T family
MSNRSCKWPEHHGSGGGVPFPVLVVVGLVIAWVWRHRAGLVHWAVAVLAVLAAAAVVVLAVRLVIRHRKPVTTGYRFRSPRWLRHLPRALWAAARWHHLTANLQLARPDRHSQGKTRRPRAVVHPSRHGVTARVRTAPGSGRAEFDQAAEHIANQWRCQRVSVSQPKPGRLVVRGLRRDPLLEQLALPNTAHVRDLRHLYLGRDEHGQDRYADLANVPGICVGGMPGAGKSTEVTSWQMQLAPSPAVQFVNLDGKGADEYRDFEPRAWLTGGDDLDEALGILETVHGLMTDRLACVRQVLGTKNAWHVGPTVEWPLVATTIDECQQYLDLTMVKGDKAAEPKVRRCIFLASSLVRRGRSVAMLTIPATQKPTTDSLPSSIRDNCPVAMSFAVRTTDAAVATLGSAIRDYPTYSPAGLALPDYTGVATVTLRTGQDPFTRLRGPLVSEDQAAGVAVASAHLRRDPRASLPVLVPDDVSALTGAT